MAHHANPYDFLTSTMKNMAVDREAMLAAHKKNLEALTEANKMAVDVMRSVSQLQQQYVKQAFENMSSMIKDFASQGASHDSWKRQAENLKNHINHSVDHSTTVASMISKSHKDVYEKMKSHVSDHLKESKKRATQKQH